MPLTIIKCQVELAHRSGLPEDKSVNTFTIMSSLNFGRTEAEYDGIAEQVADFYTEQGASNNGPVGVRLSSALSRVAGDCTIKSYDITDHLDGISNHGSPKSEIGFTLPAAAFGAYPEEVAFALTLHGVGAEQEPVEAPDDADPDLNPERPRQRRTGKLYLGPIGSGNGVADAAGRVRPTNELHAAVHDAADDLHARLALLNASWCVWSRVNAAVYPIVSVTSDDAFDTQRRRGVAGTMRLGRVL